MPQKKNPYSLAHLRGWLATNWAAGWGCSPRPHPDRATRQPLLRVRRRPRRPRQRRRIGGPAHRRTRPRRVRRGADAGRRQLGLPVRHRSLRLPRGCHRSRQPHPPPHRRPGGETSHRGRGLSVTPDSVRRAALDLNQALGDFDDAEFERNRTPEHLIDLRRGTGGAGDAAMAGMLADLGDRLSRHRAAVDGIRSARSPRPSSPRSAPEPRESTSEPARPPARPAGEAEDDRSHPRHRHRVGRRLHRGPAGGVRKPGRPGQARRAPAW